MSLTSATAPEIRRNRGRRTSRRQATQETACGSIIRLPTEEQCI